MCSGIRLVCISVCNFSSLGPDIRLLKPLCVIEFFLSSHSSVTRNAINRRIGQMKCLLTRPNSENNDFLYYDIHKQQESCEWEQVMQSMSALWVKCCQEIGRFRPMSQRYWQQRNETLIGNINNGNCKANFK